MPDPAEPRPRRLFVAVELPEPVRVHLASAVEDLRAAEPEPAGGGPSAAAVRWTDPSSWHLTLVFCGAVPPPEEAAFVAALRSAAAKHATMRLGIAGGGRFGHRVLWAGVAGDRSALVSVAAAAARAARSAGIDVERRPYRPHLTIARGGAGSDLRSTAAALSDYTGPTWLVDQLVLVESQLGAGPGRTARHLVVNVFPLG